MSLFTKTLTDGDGKKINVIMSGTTVSHPKDKSGGANIDPRLSKIKIGNEELSGWTRSSTIHTHPFGKANEFSDIRGALMGGDVQWSLANKVKLYLTTKDDYWSYVFNPAIYNKVVEKRPDGKVYSHEHKVAVKEAISKAIYLE